MQASAVNKILDAMITLLEQKPFEDITVKELVNVAGINRSSYHYHFYSLEDVLQRIFDNFTEGYVDLLMAPNNWDSNTTFDVANTYEYVLQNKSLLKTLFNRGYESQLYRMLIDKIKELYRGVEFSYINNSGETVILKDGPLFEYKISIAAYSSASIVRCWVDMDYPLSSEDMSAFLNTCMNLKIQKMTLYKDSRLQNHKGRKHSQ